MPTISSLDDLKKIREEALRKREVRSAAGQKTIVVGMGTCGSWNGYLWNCSRGS